MAAAKETTVRNLGVVMFAVADQDLAKEFYTGKLGFEVARLALLPPRGGQPGGGSIGVETPDVRGEHERLQALGVRIDSEPVQEHGAPLLFLCQDPDGNHIAVVEAP